MARVSKAKADEVALRKALETALSEEEQALVLAAVLLQLTDPMLKSLMKRLPSSTGQALHRVLRPPTDSQRKPPAASTSKLQQDWSRAWKAWDECVEGAAGEDGEFVEQEHHWEEPYLDLDGLSEALDTYAKPLLKLVPRVFEAGLEPGFSFARKVAAAAAEIVASTPDWMSGGDPLMFGPVVTEALLKWEWLQACQSKQRPFEFIQSICQLDCMLKEASLDPEAVLDFVDALSKEQRQDMREGLARQRSRAPWKGALADTDSTWADLEKELQER
jgi:hypothetical protein